MTANFSVGNDEDDDEAAMWDEPEPFIGTINSPFCVVALEISSSSSCCCHNGCDGSSADVSGITSDDDDGMDSSLSLHCKQIISLDREGGESSSSSSLAAAAARDGLILLLFVDDIMSGGDSNAEVLPSVGRQEEDVMVSWSSSFVVGVGGQDQRCRSRSAIYPSGLEANENDNLPS